MNNKLNITHLNQPFLSRDPKQTNSVNPIYCLRQQHLIDLCHALPQQLGNSYFLILCENVHPNINVIYYLHIRFVLEKILVPASLHFQLNFLQQELLVTLWQLCKQVGFHRMCFRVHLINSCNDQCNTKSVIKSENHLAE